MSDDAPDPSHAEASQGASGSDLAPIGEIETRKAELPESFRRELEEVTRAVRVIVEQAERARSDRETTHALKRVLEANATLLSALFESQKRVLGSDEKSRRAEALTLSTRALNECFRDVAKSQEALAARLESSQRSKKGVGIVAVGAVAVACLLGGLLYGGLIRDRDRASKIDGELSVLRERLASNDRDQLVGLAERFEQRHREVEEALLTQKSENLTLGQKLDEALSRAAGVERDQEALKSSLEQTRAALLETEALARRETDRAARLAGELEVTQQAMDVVKSRGEIPTSPSRDASGKASPEQRSSIPGTGDRSGSTHVDGSASPVGGSQESAHAPAGTAEQAEKESISTEPTLLDKVCGEFNARFGQVDGGLAYRLVSLAGVGPTSLRGVVVECYDGERRSRKSIESDRLEVIANTSTGEVELRFLDGKLVYQGRPYPFLNGRYGVPVLGAKAGDVVSSAVPTIQVTTRRP